MCANSGVIKPVLHVHKSRCLPGGTENLVGFRALWDWVDDHKHSMKTAPGPALWIVVLYNYFSFYVLNDTIVSISFTYPCFK